MNLQALTTTATRLRSLADDLERLVEQAQAEIETDAGQLVHDPRWKRGVRLTESGQGKLLECLKTTDMTNKQLSKLFDMSISAISTYRAKVEAGIF